MMLQELGITVSILVGLSILLKSVRRFFSRVWQKTLGRNSYMLKKILLELQPNGGHTVKDIIYRIEEKQLSFEAYLKASSNIFSEAIFRTNVDGLYIETNRAYQIFTGYSYALGEGWINSVLPEERESIINKWYSAIKAEREFSEDVTILCPHKGVKKSHLVTFKEVDSQGKLRGYLGVLSEYP